MCLVNFETQYRKQNSIEKLKDWLFDIRAFPPFINLIRCSYQVQSKLKVVNMNDQQPYIMIELTLLKKMAADMAAPMRWKKCLMIVTLIQLLFLKMIFLYRYVLPLYKPCWAQYLRVF